MDCNYNVKDVASASDQIKICDVESGTFRYITPESIRLYIEQVNNANHSIKSVSLNNGRLVISYTSGDITVVDGVTSFSIVNGSLTYS